MSETGERPRAGGEGARLPSTDDLVRETALRMVRRRGRRIDRTLLLMAVRRSLNLPITKDRFKDVMQGYLAAEMRVDQRGRVIGTWLDLPENVALRRTLREEANAARNAREESV